MTWYYAISIRIDHYF